KTASGYEVLVDKGLNREGMLQAAQGKDFMDYAKGVVNKGESYLLENDGTKTTDWFDAIAQLKAQAALQGEDWYDYDNFALKAYADPAPPSTAIVPDLSDKSEADAVAALGAVGFVGKAGEPAYSDTIAAGRVMGQDVAAGVEAEKGSTVTYILSLGKKPATPPSVDPAGPPTGGDPSMKGPLASTGDSAGSRVGLASLGLLLACGALATARMRMRKVASDEGKIPRL
ncbi:MAG: PASTA domain-containing protein, partial [Gordonibacter sp.]